MNTSNRQRSKKQTKPKINHDRNFKELLSVFFIDFVELFLPDVAQYIDRTSIEFLEKEVFTDVIVGEKHIIDLIVKAKFRDKDTFFLIHVENQASARAAFPMRMLGYVSRLHLKYHLPIYPVVVLSYDRPIKPAPNSYEIAFPGKSVLKFEYQVIQLNRLPWRQFMRQSNPVASALMAKMQMLPEERPKVKLECLRLLATLKLDPARSELIGRFVESYLKLTADEMKQYEREFEALEPEEKEATMELMTYWGQKGKEEGIQVGKQEGIQIGKEGLLAKMLNYRFGTISPEIQTTLRQLTAEQLDELGEAFLDFTSPDDLKKWLSKHNLRN